MGAHHEPTTSPTLLHWLTLPGADEAWEVFIDRYGPLIDARCRRAGLQPADADDIRASVCAQLVVSLRGFQYDPARRFRGYLKRVVDNAIISQWRTLRCRPGWVGQGGEAVDSPPEPFVDLGAVLEEQIRSRLDDVLRAIDRVRSEVGAEAWQAFALTTFEGLSGAEAAARLGKSAAAVYMAKCRVLARLRAEANVEPDG